MSIRSGSKILPENLDGNHAVQSNVGRAVDLARSAGRHQGLKGVGAKSSPGVAAGYGRLFFHAPVQRGPQFPAGLGIQQQRRVEAVSEQRFHLGAQLVVTLARGREEAVTFDRGALERGVIGAFDRAPATSGHRVGAAPAPAMLWRSPSRV